MLEDPITREVKSKYKLETYNANTPKIVLEKVKKDRRLKEWVLWKDKDHSHVRVRREKEKEKEYVEIENYMEMEKLQQGIGLKVLESIESQAPTIVKRKELSDISNLVQKLEIGLQMIFSTYSLEKAVKKDIERLKVTAHEVQEIRKKESLVVECLKWEICLINRIVENSHIRYSLIEVLEQNEIYNSLVFYTDGLLGFSESKEKIEMGCGLVQVTEEGHIICQVACGTEKWFSSTRAELVAILVALLVTPNEKEVEIRTDSSAAIFAIKKDLRRIKQDNGLKVKMLVWWQQ